MTFEQALNNGRAAHADGVGTGRAGVTIITNQIGGRATFATGVLYYYPASGTGPIAAADGLRTMDGQPLEYLFSDRAVPLPPPTDEDTPRGGFGVSGPMQPFNVTAADKLGVRIASSRAARLLLVSHGNMQINVQLEDRADVLVGVAGGIGGTPAVYVVSFYQLPAKG